MEVNRLVPNIGPRISIYTHEGDLATRLGSPEGVGAGPGRFYSPHGIAVDSRFDIYIGGRLLMVMSQCLAISERCRSLRRLSEC